MHVIETTAFGITFRSRTEARWAVFFKTLGIAFHYEPEGYKLASGCYLPDFWLPKQDCFFEVKGKPPELLEIRLAVELSEVACKAVYIATGPPSHPWPTPGDPSPSADYFSVSEMGMCHGDHRWWCECYSCGLLGLAFEGQAAHLPCGCLLAEKDRAGFETRRLIEAYETSQRERFGT